MKIKTIPHLTKMERPAGEWVGGRFVPIKHKLNGRLPQLSKVRHKRTDSEAIQAWKESERHE